MIPAISQINDPFCIVMKRLSILFALWVGACTLCAQDNVVISEFMASNDQTLADEDGHFEDWIEIYNAGTNTVNLNNWQLGDRNNLWAFPATNLPPNGFLVVFASNKNRRIPGRELHTNFRLDADPAERVRLLRPDASVASEFNPPPLQVTDYSYGFPLTQTPITMLTTGASARLLVPPNGNLGATWTSPEFNDSAWTAVNNGVGFEADAPASAVATIMADSVTEFSDTQGANNWVYGYWDKRNDVDGNYQASTEFIPFPRGTGTTLNSTNYWNGTAWNWPPPADPPWTELTASGGHPAGANGSPTDPIHWTVRRYISETNGLLRLSGILACNSQNTACGDGTIGRIYVDGVEVFQRTVRGESFGYAVQVNASVGSFIDFVIDPGAADNDSCDTTTFTTVIRTAADTALVADTIADWSDTGAQGYKGWTYGAFIKTNTSVVYATSRFGAFPSGTGPHSANNFWNGESYQWFDGDPPFDRIGQHTCHPNIFPSTSTTNSQEHWVIRRWVSEIAGTLHVDWHLGKKELTGAGATAKVFRNGTQIAAMTIGGTNFAGSNRTDVINNVQVGDLIDFTVEPGADIVGDNCFFNASIHGFSTLANQFRTDVGSMMTNANATAYLRIPFTITDAAAIRTLVLRLKYDDGITAYINGNLVASRNAPEPLLWNSAATASRIDADAGQFEEFDLTAAVVDLLRTGNNVLAIQGLNSSISDLDFLIVAELKGSVVSLNTSSPNYFAAPTPGSANGVGSVNVGPVITAITHTPHDPADDEDLVVTARIVPVLHPVGANGVRLYYRVQFGAEVNVVMHDDGLHVDGAAGDGVYGATIPHTASGIGQAVRYYITAADTQASLTRQPAFPHQLFSSQYFGAVVKNPALTNPLEVLHFFITDANLTAANNAQDGRFPCSVYFLGEFYDNISINRHGQSSQGFPKKSYDMDFNSDHNFRWDPNERRVDDINLLTTYPDKAHIRNIIGYETLADAGAAHHFVIPVRVQTNGGFFGDWHMMENGDDRYLERIGRDPKGSLYKMYNTFTDPTHYTIAAGGAEKKTRRHEGNADLQALYNGVNTGTIQARTNYMYDNINIAASINAFAARAVTSEHDCCHKNYYFYRDSDGSGEWEGMAWDMDLSFGRNWQGGETYFDDRVYVQNRVWGNWDNNNFFRLVFNQPVGSGNDATRQMYLRRARTIADELQQTNGTPASQLYYENRIDELAGMIAPDAAMDLAKWGTWGGGATGIFATNNSFWRTLPQSVAELKTNYMVNRRAHVFGNRWGMGAEFPDPQPTNVVILIGTVEYNPASGNQNEEYIRLVNTNNIAVDISHWTLSGAIEHTFQGGVVLPRNGGSVYVVPNKRAFRNRAVAPRGGMGLYVEGPYRGQLSARGETIILADKVGRVVQTNQYPGNATPAQNSLRVTEIMYHPSLLPGSLFGPEEFEYIELRNIGATTLNLTGVHFTNGIEFTFTASLVTSLAPGAYVLVVKNIAAFESRYGPGFNIAGQYIGSLDNGGETIEINDGAGEKVQDFSFNNSWYPITDGAGASLVIINDAAPWDSWGLKESWRPSTYDDGTPGAGDSPAITVAPVLVNEVLSHTDLPDIDRVELYNTNTVAVDVGGWFISDDFEEPKKFRIPDGTIIAAGDYMVFDEDDFNPGGMGFAFSSTDDEVYLFSGDGTKLTAYFHGFAYGPAETGVSFGRYLDSVTNEHFVASSANTFGAANAYPKMGPVVVSEIMYHPAVDNDWEEFVELHNLSLSAVALYDVQRPTNTWRLRGGVDFNFPTNQSLASGAFAIVVSFNPTNTVLLEQFRTRYGLSPSLAIYGPYDGQLDNAGDSVRLLKPDAPEGADVPYILVEAVDYLDTQPWPLAADGIGASLQRKVLANFGNDPANWAGGLSPGGNFGGTPPAITSQSGNQTTVAGRTLTLNASVTGSEPMYFQWRHNSNNLPGAASSALIIPNIQPNQAGTYNLVVYNSAGSAESTNIQVVVQLPPRITSQPVSVAVTPNNNVTFTVGATSVNTNIISYQWRFNGVDIPGANSNSYTIVSAQLANDGFYSVLVSDWVDAVLSVPARLTILIQPFIVQQPMSQYVPQGSSATLSVSVTNTATLPVTNRWRRISGSSGGPATNIVFGLTDFFTVTNVQGSNRYDVIVYNQGRPLGFQSVTVFLSAIPDADSDGLPDAWETENNVTDPAADPDGDTMTNLAEYIAGTDPNNGQSYLKVEQLTLGAGVSIEFMALSNKTYTIESTDVLGNAAWNRVRDIYATSNSGPVTVPDPTASSSNRFYRLVTPKKR